MQTGQLWVRWCDVAVGFAARSASEVQLVSPPVYGVVCSELDEGVQDLVGGGCRAWWPAPTRGQRPYFALASGVTGVNRLTSPPSGSRRMTERLPHGMSVGASTISGTV